MVSLNVIRTTAIALFLCAAANAQASLVIVDPTISGETVSLPIHLQGPVSDGVAAMDFQLSFDPAILRAVQVEAGAAVTQAGKTVQAQLLRDGVYSVLMFGGDLSGVIKGEIARVALTKIAEPKSGETPVTIAETKFATVSSVEIPSLGSTTTLLFEPEEEDQDGEAGALPPVFGGGSPVADTPVQNDAPTTAEPTADVTNEKSPGASNPISPDLAEARAFADSQIANLKQARAQREAARAQLDQQPADPRGGSSGIRIRREIGRGGSNAEPTSEPRPSREARERAGESMATPAPPPSGEQVAPAKLDAESSPPPVLDPPQEFPGPDYAEAPELDDTPGRRGRWVQAAVIGACVAAALGLYAYQRRR